MLTEERIEELVAATIERVVWGGEIQNKVAEELKFDTSMMISVKRIASAARKRDIEFITGELRSSSKVTPRLVETIYGYLKIDLPDELVKEIEKYKAEWKASYNERTKIAREAKEKKKPSGDNATPIWAQSILLNQAKLISQLDELMDAVIPKYARDIVESNEKLDTHLIQLLNKLS